MKKFVGFLFLFIFISAISYLPAQIVQDDVAGPLLLYANQDIKDFFNQTKGTRVVREQNRAFASADAEAMRPLYTKRATLHIGPDESFAPLNVFVAKGPDEIVEGFAFFLSEEGGLPLGTVSTITSVSRHGNFIYQTFNSVNDVINCDGTDTYVTIFGKIARQSAFVVCELVE